MTAPLVGREAELTAALAVLDTRSAAAIRIVGEPGIGKTRLLDEIGLRAEGMDTLILRGRAIDRHGDVPFEVVDEALGRWLRAADRHGGLSLYPHERSALGPILLGIAPGAAVADERYVVHAGIRRVIERAARRQRVVLIFDDLHCADTASLDLIDALLRRPLAGPVVIVLAWRDPGWAQLTTRMADASAGLPGVQVRLGALEPDAVADLLDPALPREEVRRITDESGGNPFYVQQLARAWRVDHDAGLPYGASGAEGITAAVRVEIEALEPPSDLLAEGGAVVGDPFDVDIAAAAGGVAEDDVPAALDALVRTGLVHATDDPVRFAFRHPIVRSVIYDATGPGWRRAAHGRAAAALAVSGAAKGLRAEHVAQFAQVGDPLAVGLLAAAASETLSVSPRSAISWLTVALRLAPEGSDLESRRPLLLTTLAAAHAAAGELAAAREVLAVTVELTADRGLRDEMLRILTLIELANGLHADAAQRLPRMLEAARDPRTAARMRVLAACAALTAMEIDAMDEQLALALPVLAERVDDLDDAYRVAALALQALVLGFRGDRAGARERVDEALLGMTTSELQVGRSDAGHEHEGALVLVAIAAHRVGRAADADRLLHQIVERGVREGGQMQQLSQVMVHRSATRLTRGAIPEARRLAAVALEMARLAGTPWVLSNALTHQASVLLLAGDLAGAVDAVSEAEQQLPSTGDAYERFRRRQWAPVQLAAGEPEQALELIGTIDAVDFADVFVGMRAAAYECAVEAHLARGTLAEARAWAERGLAEAREDDEPLALLRVHRAAARVWLAEGDPEAARTAAVAAREHGMRGAAVVEQAISGLVLGQALAAVGEREAALEQLGEAESVLREHGAMRLRSEAVRELRKLGRRVAGVRRAPHAEGRLGALTEREREVAELLATGKTNREIAALMVVSDRTVETHVRNILRRLEVRSRTAVAALVLGGDAHASRILEDGRG